MVHPSKRRSELRRRAEENVKRRMKERQRAALIQSLVYFGDNKLKEFCRDQGLKMAFDVSFRPHLCLICPRLAKAFEDLKPNLLFFRQRG